MKRRSSFRAWNGKFLARQIQYDAPVSVKVIGQLTDETVPGLKRHLRNALSAALSRMGLSVLFDIETLLTLPVTGSMVIATTPSPLIFCRLASQGYSGRGA